MEDEALIPKALAGFYVTEDEHCDAIPKKVKRWSIEFTSQRKLIGLVYLMDFSSSL